MNQQPIRQRSFKKIMRQQQQQQEKDGLMIVNDDNNNNNDDEDDNNSESSKDGLYHSNNTDNNTSNTSFLTPVIWCILITETAERFAYFGFRAILVLYFTIELQYNDNIAISLFAFISSLAYFSPLLGAIIADGTKFGRYRTILYFSSIYIIGLIILTYAAFISIHDDDNNNNQLLQWKRYLTGIGLFLVCIGTGGIKPCVSAFGADQVALASSSSKHDHDHNNSINNNLDESESSSSRLHIDTMIPLDPRETTIIVDRNDDDNNNNNNNNNNTEHHVRAFFNYFYFCINVGALTSIAVVPLLRGYIGFGYAFAAPCTFMIIAILAFLSKRKEYIHHKSNNDENNNIITTFRITWWLLLHQIYSHDNFIRNHFPQFHPSPEPPIRRRINTFDNDNDDNNHNSSNNNVTNAKANNDDNNYDDDAIQQQQQQQQVTDASQALHALPVLAMFPIFWCLYDQQGSVWTLQATRMEMAFHGMQPEQLNIINPLEIMIFIPLFEQIIYPYLESYNINISPIRRMSWGMILTSLSFFISGLVESAIERSEENNDDDNNNNKINVLWQLPQITILAVGEIFLSVTGLEFAYTTSPTKLKAFITALFLCTTGIGDTFSGILYSTIFTHINRAIVMHICAILMLINLRIFLHVAKWYENHKYHNINNNNNDNTLVEEDDDEEEEHNKNHSSIEMIQTQ